MKLCDGDNNCFTSEEGAGEEGGPEDVSRNNAAGVILYRVCQSLDALINLVRLQEREAEPEVAGEAFPIHAKGRSFEEEHAVFLIGELHKLVRVDLLGQFHPYKIPAPRLEIPEARTAEHVREVFIQRGC